MVLTGLAKPTITKLRREGNFPTPLKLTEGGAPAIGWRASDIRAWIDARPPAGGGV